MKRVNVTIIDPTHPHVGCSGHIEINDNDTVTVAELGNVRMIRVELDQCSHRVDACFVRHRAGMLRFETPLGKAVRP